VINGWGEKVGQEIEPSSWDECATLLLRCGGEETIYRGHGSYDWQLLSSLERALLQRAKQWDDRKYQVMQSPVVDSETEDWAKDIEQKQTLFFRRNAVMLEVPGLPEPWDTVGWWEIMQHHNAPTRLMDWTTSPFVALWFALEGHEDGSGDMALWIYDCRNGTLNHAQAVAKFNATEGYEQLDDRRAVNRYVQLALEDGNPALIPVQPRQFPRAVAQQSVLTVVPSICTSLPSHDWVRHRLATRIRLREEWKPDMTAACRSMGLSRPTLFRDLDSLGATFARALDGSAGTADGTLQ
jgi:DNA-binding phage protein